MMPSLSLFKKKYIRFSPFYFALFFMFFVFEVLIALYVRDNFVRPYLGDTLVVILIYSLVRSFVNSDISPTIIAVLLFSYCVEVMQYFNVVDLLGLGGSEFARIIFGTSFAWADMVAYTVGAAIIAIAECYSFYRNNSA